MDYKKKLSHLCMLIQESLLGYGLDIGGSISCDILGDDSEPHTIFAVIKVLHRDINFTLEVGVTSDKNYHLFLGNLSLAKELEELDVFTTILNKILSCALIDKVIVHQSTNEYLNKWCKTNHFIEMDGDYYKTFESIKGYQYEYTTYVCDGEVISDVYKINESINPSKVLASREKVGSLKGYRFSLESIKEFIDNLTSIPNYRYFL